MFNLENATLAIFYEEEIIRLGTLAFSLPRSKDSGAVTSSVLLGGENLIISRFLAERLAVKTNKMSLVSIYTRLPEKRAFRIFSKLIDECLDEKK